ncbi:MAG: FAD-binding oxidoreductase [Candidatus Kapaibacterium sp.]|nr:MAG: FAD-binding oxidoreductase [Candidatus Kapabacteria bacterium]
MLHKTDPDVIFTYLTDASNMPGGSADEIYIPESPDELREALLRCSEAGKRITIAGSGTGLAGARVPFGGAVISTERLNKILSIDATRLRAVVQPGVRLSEFQTACEEHGCLYPPDPTERAAAMGGTVACNSSGARTFKYGATRAFVEGLRVFLPDGEEVRLERGTTFARDGKLTLTTESGKELHIALPAISMPAMKHAAGYFIKPDMDAIDLFIGSEGTLGAIAEITVRLLPMPERIIAGVVFFDSLDGVMTFVEEARQRSQEERAKASSDKSSSNEARNDEASDDIDLATLGIESRALEYFDKHALEFVHEEYPRIPANAVAAVWFEQEVTDHTEERLLELWYDLISRTTTLMDECWFAITEKDQEELREFRHAVPAKTYERIRELKQRKIGTDMAVPDKHFRALYDFYVDEFTKEKLDYIIFGHIGNSHVHANIFTNSPEEFTHAKTVYHRCVMKALELGGTISAEHGVGKIKAPYLRDMYGNEAIKQFAALKRVFDTRNLLGIGTIFEEEHS